MKSLYLFVIATVSAITTFAQKTGANPAPKPNILQVQNACPEQTDVINDPLDRSPRYNLHSSFSGKEQMKMEVAKIDRCSLHNKVIIGHARICPGCKPQLVIERRGSKQAYIVNR